MKKVIIIGGGFAGSHAARYLEKFFSVTLIDKKNYFEFTPGVLRTIVEPEHLEEIQVLHSDYLKKTKVVVGKVSEVAKDFVKVNGKKLKFDYLILASGSRYSSPFKDSHLILAARAKTLKKHYDEVCRAKKILIIGGGLVGVELAAEIASKYEDKKIIIVHAAEKIMQRNSEKTITSAEKFLADKGVEIVYNDKVVKSENGIYSTEKGRKIQADVIFSSTGIIPNSELMNKNFSAKMDEKKHLKVNEFLQLNGKKNIFVVGDVNNLSEEKTAQNAQRQAKIAVKNIVALDSGKNLREYRAKKTPLIISLGKSRGIFTSGNYTSYGFTPSLMKSFVEKWEIWKKRYF